MTISGQNIDKDVSDINAQPPLTLKAIRALRGYSIDDLAVTSGLTWQEITDIEAGKDADIRLLRRLATALQIPIEIVSGQRPLA